MGSNRLHNTRIHYHVRGRADALLTIAAHLGWSDKLTDTIAADVLALDRIDLFYARKRREDCA